MAPPLSRRRAESAARDSRTALIRTRLKASLQAASSRSATVPKTGPRVLLTSTSSPPNVVTAQSARLVHCSACRRSATLAWTSRPSACSACAAASRCSALLDEIATRQPSAASARAAAKPSPLLAAVTRARRPWRPVSKILELLAFLPAGHHRVRAGAHLLVDAIHPWDIGGQEALRHLGNDRV